MALAMLHNPVGVGGVVNGHPRVARSSQPWASRQSPVGAVPWPTIQHDFYGIRAITKAKAKKTTLISLTRPPPPAHPHETRIPLDRAGDAR